MSLIKQNWKFFFFWVFALHLFCAPAFSDPPIHSEKDGVWAEELVKRLRAEREKAAGRDNSAREIESIWSEIQNMDDESNEFEEKENTSTHRTVIAVSATGATVSSLFSLTIEPRDLPHPYSRHLSPTGLNFSILAAGTTISCVLAITALKLAPKFRKSPK